MNKLLHSVAVARSCAQRLMCCLAALCCVGWPTMCSLAQSPDGPSTMEGYEFLRLRPQHISAHELSKALQLVIGNQGSQAVLEEQDAVVVAAAPATLQRAARMLEQIDTPRQQVRLAVYLFDVELNELKQLSLAAAAQLKAQAFDASGLPIDASGDLKSEQTQFHVLANRLNLKQVLQLLSECPGARLLADPQMTVVDRQSASLDSVTRLPLAVVSASQSLAGATNFEEAGVKLSLTPRVLDYAHVELRIVTEYSSLSGFNSQGNPIIEVRRAETIARVANRQLLVIGGLRKRTSAESSVTAPGLNSWKSASPLSRTTTAEVNESELICLVCPEIVPTVLTPASDVARYPSTVLQSQAPLAQSLQPQAWNDANQDVPSLTQSANMQAPLSPDSDSLVQSGIYQVPMANPATPQVTPSAYRPSVYAKPRQQNAHGRNINTSRNAVTQPLPFSKKPSVK